MDTLVKDLTYAARGLRKNLGFAAVATITIALGIGGFPTMAARLHVLPKRGVLHGLVGQRRQVASAGFIAAQAVRIASLISYAA